MIEIIEKSISPALAIDRVRSPASGYVVTRTGLTCNTSQGRVVHSINFQNTKVNAKKLYRESPGKSFLLNS